MFRISFNHAWSTTKALFEVGGFGGSVADSSCPSRQGLFYPGHFVYNHTGDAGHCSPTGRSCRVARTSVYKYIEILLWCICIDTISTTSISWFFICDTPITANK